MHIKIHSLIQYHWKRHNMHVSSWVLYLNMAISSVVILGKQEQFIRPEKHVIEGVLQHYNNL